MAGTAELAHRLASVVTIQREIAGIESDAQAVMALVVDRLRDLTSSDGAVIELVEGDEMVYRAASGHAAESIGLRLSRNGSLSGECVRTSSVIHCPDTEKDDRVDHEACERIGVRSMIVVPLMHEGSTIGVLKVFSRRPGSFSDLDAYTLQMLSGMVAGAMSRATEYSARIASEGRYRLLFRENVAGAFTTTVEGKILDVNDSLARMLGCSDRNDLLSHESWDFYPEREQRENFISALRNGGTVHDYRMTLKRKDGRLIGARMNASLLPQGEETYVLGTLVESEEAPSQMAVS